ncbi:hypothetical protein C8Q75DRAFT_753247 [Abortiporus biennis]|nr:hypothetical protein C8Q75DRAFT_753247 [Abortiporus biennis]
MASNTVFSVPRDCHVVRVENIPPSVGAEEIVDLFRTLIGEVSGFNALLENNRRYLDLSLASQDALRKALCMTGYNIGGSPLTVTAVEPQRAPGRTRQVDTRRNLYVLGLPFDLTKTEFVEIFSRYGVVSHAVILATVDNASRRRGFIVMGTHQHAKAAMDHLSRKEIKGHTIDVSWAVVQRSQGFLDGGDRTIMLSNQPVSVSALENSVPVDAPAPRIQSPITVPPQVDNSVHNTVCATPATLLVTNLPATLFSTDADLRPLFCPYGQVKEIKILGISDQGNISVLVEFGSRNQALEARDMLRGQIYANQPVNVEFMESSPVLQSTRDSITGGLPYRRSSVPDSKMRLNPNAPPFAVSFPKVPMSTDPWYMKTQPAAPEQENKHPFGHVATRYQTLSLAPSPTPAQSSLLPPSVPFRPNSAPSRYARNTLGPLTNYTQDNWMDETPFPPATLGVCSPQNNWPNISTPSLYSTYTA